MTPASDGVWNVLIPDSGWVSALEVDDEDDDCVEAETAGRGAAIAVCGRKNQYAMPLTTAAPMMMGTGPMGSALADLDDGMLESYSLINEFSMHYA